MNAAAVTSGDPAAQPPANPFPGLRPYDRQRELFGRDRDLVLFKDRLYAARTTLLFAASGVGKSSFLQAKVVPELESEEHLVIAHARWSARAPLDALRESWLKALAARLREQPAERERCLPEVASSDEAEIARALAQLWAGGSPLAFARRFAELDTVLLLDQFEEPLNSLVDDPAVNALVEALSALINDAQLPLRVVFSMRQEFLAELSLFENRVPDLFANYYNLRHPDPKHARTIIESTVTAGGAKFDSDGVKALVEDLLLVGGLQPPPGQSGETRPLRFVVPPVLQIVCSRMWSESAARLKAREVAFAAGYRAGRAHELVQSFVEELIAKLDDGQKALLSQALEFLVSRQGGKIAYEVGVLAEHLRCERAQLDATLGALSIEPDRVFRRIDRSDKTTWYELYHDVYAGALSAWKARFEVELERRAQENLKLEKKKSRKQTLQGCGIVLALAGVIVVWAADNNASDTRDALRNAGDDYSKARAAYEALGGNPFKTRFGLFDADEHMAEFWDRRAHGAVLAQSRESALMYALEALTTKATPRRRQLANQIIGDDLSEIVATYHTSEPIVALSRDGERYATLGRGGVVVSSLEKSGGAVLSVPRVEFSEVLLGDHGDMVWALGKRSVDSKGGGYEQKGGGKGEEEFGMWARSLTAVDEAATSWVGPARFGLAPPDAWSVSADGRTAVCAWARESRSRLIALHGAERNDLQPGAPIASGGSKAVTWAWEVAISPDGSSVAFADADNTLIAQSVNGENVVVLSSFAALPRMLLYSPDGRQLAVALQGGGVYLLPADKTTPKPVALESGGEAMDLAFSGDGQHLYASTVAGVEAWNVASRASQARIAGQIELAPSLASASGDFLGIADASTLVRWSNDLKRQRWSRVRSAATVEDEEDELRPLCARGDECVAVTGARVLQRFKMRGNDAPRGWVGSVRATLSPDGKRAIVDDGLRYAMLDVSTGDALATPIEFDEPTQMSFDFDASGQHAFALVGDEVRELPNGNELAVERLLSLARIFVVGNGNAIVLEAEDTLWLVPTTVGGKPNPFAQAEQGEVLVAEAIDSSRRFLAAASSSESSGHVVRVYDLDGGKVLGKTISANDVSGLAIDSTGRRVAIVDASQPAASGGQQFAITVFDALTAQPLTSFITSSDPQTMAFAPAGAALVVRTPTSLIRIPLEGDAKPSARFLRRASLLREPVPNWFDADDPNGERPRVLVLDENGRIALERVRFDDADVAPIDGQPDTLRSEWQRRLDLRIDGNGQATVPSGTSGGSF